MLVVVLLQRPFTVRIGQHRKMSTSEQHNQPQHIYKKYKIWYKTHIWVTTGLFNRLISFSGYLHTFFTLTLVLLLLLYCLCCCAIAVACDPALRLFLYRTLLYLWNLAWHLSQSSIQSSSVIKASRLLSFVIIYRKLTKWNWCRIRYYRIERIDLI